jgi:hypothetical protein
MNILINLYFLGRMDGYTLVEALVRGTLKRVSSTYLVSYKVSSGSKKFKFKTIHTLRVVGAWWDV